MSIDLGIIGIGSYLPSRVVSNDELCLSVDTSDEWITRRTGIKSRHIAEEGETTLDMALLAAERVMKNSGTDPSEIGLIICATSTPNYTFPGCAVALQHLLKCKLSTAAFDINVVCAGFVYALNLAYESYSSKNTKTLVIGAEKMTSLLDWNDRSTCVLFGDGAGAVILSPLQGSSILARSLGSDGSSINSLRTTGGVSSNGIVGNICMEGRIVFNRAIGHFLSSILDVLSSAELTLEDVDMFVLHQANVRIIKSVAEKLGLSLDKFAVTIDHHANTSAASIPLALSEINDAGLLKRGDIVLLSAVGAGMSWGSILLRY